MLRTRWLLAVLCLVGSGCGPNKPGGGAHARLRTQADDALKQAAALDYQSPVSAVRAERRAKAADLYLSSCTKDGDVSSCVWAASLSRRKSWNDNEADAARLRAATDVLVQRCLTHDPVACRAFDGDLGEAARDYSGSPDDLCAKGFAPACYASSQWVSTERQRNQLDPTMLTLLTKGCDLGDPRACHFAIDLAKEKSEPQADEIAQLTMKRQKAAFERCARGYPASCDAVPHNQAKTAAAAAESCTRGYLEACSLAAGDNPAIEQRWAQACAVTGIGCDALADFASDATAKRDALEHGCELGNPDVCVTLVKGYHTKTFPEPVPGRAAALVDYLCSGKAGSTDHCDEVKP